MSPGAPCGSFDSALSFPPAELFRHRKPFIDDGEVAIVVQDALVIPEHSKNIGPEIDIGLEFRRLWKGLIGCRNRQKRHSGQK